MTLDDRIAEELSRLYWESDVPVAEIARQLEISKHALYTSLRPTQAPGACPECGEPLYFPHRTARAAGEAECLACGREADVPAEAVRSVAPAFEAAYADYEPPEHSAVLAPFDTDAALRRGRLVTLGGAALAGAAIGALATLLASRR
jgi:transposase-like protein